MSRRETEARAAQTTVALPAAHGPSTRLLVGPQGGDSCNVGLIARLAGTDGSATNEPRPFAGKGLEVEKIGARTGRRGARERRWLARPREYVGGGASAAHRRRICGFPGRRAEVFFAADQGAVVPIAKGQQPSPSSARFRGGEELYGVISGAKKEEHGVLRLPQQRAKGKAQRWRRPVTAMPAMIAATATGAAALSFPRKVSSSRLSLLTMARVDFSRLRV